MNMYSQENAYCQVLCYTLTIRLASFVILHACIRFEYNDSLCISSILLMVLSGSLQTG